MEDTNRKQCLSSSDPVSNLSFDVTLKRLRTGRTKKTEADSNPVVSDSVGGETVAALTTLTPVTQYASDEEGRVSLLSEVQPIQDFYSLKRTIPWQAKILSKREVCSCSWPLVSRYFGRRLKGSN